MKERWNVKHWNILTVTNLCEGTKHPKRIPDLKCYAWHETATSGLALSNAWSPRRAEGFTRAVLHADLPIAVGLDAE